MSSAFRLDGRVRLIDIGVVLDAFIDALAELFGRCSQ